MRKKMLKSLIMGTIFTGLLLTGFAFASTNSQEITDASIKVSDSEVSYPDMAQVDIKQAMDTALTEAPGKVLKAGLEDENGFLVYDIEVVTSAQQIMDVKIDAGNGAVLLVEKDTEDGNHNESGDTDNEERGENGHKDNDRED